MPVLNAEARHVFSVVDLTAAPVSGLTASNFTLSLKRRSGASLIASSETVTIQAIGGGDYWVIYTPTLAATLYVLQITPTSTSNVANPYMWEDDVVLLGPSVTGPYLTTRDRVKAAFEFKGDSHDAAIDNLLPQVTDLFQTYCNRKFFSATVTEYPPPLSRCVRVLLAARPPITAITSLHFSAALPRVYDAATLLVEGTDFIVSEDGQCIEFVAARYPGVVDAKCARLIYTGGYASIPGDLERAAQEVTGVKIQKSIGGGMYHFLNQTVGDGNLQGLRWDDITPNALMVMDAYRLRMFA